jgi:membrane protein insertase Oxa1/YidC/SpoIIIJ
MVLVCRIGGTYRSSIRLQRRLCSSKSDIAENINSQASMFGVDPSAVYDPSFPVEMFQRTAIRIHDSLGISWASTLALIALGFRVITSPLYAGSAAVGKRRANAAKELTELRDMAKEAVLLKDQQLVDQIDKEYKQRMNSLGLTGNPLQGFGYLISCQVPWATIFFVSLRGMATQPSLFESFVYDSKFLWCESLALADPYGVLPLISTAAVALSTKSNTKPPSNGETTPSLSMRDQAYIKYAIRGACFTFLPFAMQLPAGLLIFFLINNVFNRVAGSIISRYAFQKK